MAFYLTCQRPPLTRYKLPPPKSLEPHSSPSEPHSSPRNQLWRDGSMGSHSLSALLNAIFFYNGRCFHLRGVQEHEQLKFGQIVRNSNPDRYTYYEHGSKNYSGGVNDDTDGNIVTILASSHPHSHVRLLDLYFFKVPQHTIRPGAPFYLKPLPFTPTGIKPWFWEDPLPKT